MTKADRVSSDRQRLRLFQDADLGDKASPRNVNDRAHAPKWRRMLEKELRYRTEFEGLSQQAWLDLLRTRSVTSTNHDTVLSLDCPHYCAAAGEAHV